MKQRVAHALRLAAPSLSCSHSAPGAFLRPVRAKLGAPKAISATAHKLSPIIYHVMTTRQPYEETRLVAGEEQYSRRTESRLRAKARVLSLELARATPQTGAASQ